MLTETDYNLEKRLQILFAETADVQRQAEADKSLANESQTDESHLSQNSAFLTKADYSSVRIRASSPHVLTIQGKDNEDKEISLISSKSTFAPDLCLTFSNPGMFGFNMALYALKASVDESWTVFPDEMKQRMLSHIPIGKTVSGQDDSCFLRMTRLDEKGSVLMTIENKIMPHINSLSALFSEKSDISHAKAVPHHIMTGVQVLGSAMSVMKRARENGMLNNMEEFANRNLRGANLEGIANMFMDFDQK